MQQTIKTLADAGVRKTDALHVLQLDELGHLSGLAYAEYHVYDVLGRIAQLPQMTEDLHGLIQLLLQAKVEHLLD